MTNITTQRSILSVGLNTACLCFLTQALLSQSSGIFDSVWTVYSTKKRSVSHIFCAARFREHCTLFTVTRGNFAQNVMLLICCEFRLLFIRRETKTQLLFMSQFRHSWRHSDEIISFAGRKVNRYELDMMKCKYVTRQENHSSNSVSQLSQNTFPLAVMLSAPTLGTAWMGFAKPHRFG